MIKGIRKISLACVALIATALVAWGDIKEPIEILVPVVMTSGESAEITLNMEGSGTAHIQSIPSGVVDTQVTVSNGLNFVSFSVATGYSGPVVIYATVAGSSQSVSAASYVQ
jgi:hypothetical protein